MVRFFIHLLLFVIVFLSGMLFGIDREHAQFNIPTNFESINPEKIEEEPHATSHPDDIIIVEESADMDTPVHATQKTASFLEAGVKGFYEVVVDILYQISTLFF